VRAAVPLAVLLVLPTAAAFHRDTLPLLSAGGGVGDGWVAWKMTLDGSPVALDLHVTYPTDVVAWGVYVIDASGAAVAAGVFALAPGTGYGGFTLPVTINVPDSMTKHVGTRRVLAWTAGGQTAWSWTLRGGGTNAVLATSTGPEAFLLLPRDFAATVGAEEHETVTWGLGGRVVVDGAAHVDVARTLWGAFVADATKGACVGSDPSTTFPCEGEPTWQFRAETPRGTRACGTRTCAFLGEPAGSYTFRLNGADARTLDHLVCVPETVPLACVGYDGQEDAVFLAGADVALPS